MASLALGEAYTILELPIGADPDAIRTSYKRLAQKWHPEKNQKSQEAEQIFHRINLAYARLSSSNDKPIKMTQDQMYAQYQQVMYPKYRHAMLDDDYDSSVDDDSCTTSDSENDPLSTVFNYLGPPGSRRRLQQDHGDGESDNESSLTAEQREQIANELITGEEKKKLQLEKRRLKKKQRREKKRLEKRTAEAPKQENSKKSEKLKDEMPASKVKKDKTNNSLPMPQLPVNQESDSAVFSQLSKKKLELSSAAARLKNDADNHTSPAKSRQNPADEVDPVILRSRQFAIQGNNMACSGQYAVAIEFFTKAIQLDGSDYRFFGNRSYCYERLIQHDRALKDANKAISLAADWPKGYFRKGRALLGLKSYAAAEEAFMQVLKLDSKCEDARQELNRVRTCQLMEMGFSEPQAQNAVRQFDTLQQALDSLLAGLVSENPTLDDVYISDDDEPSLEPPVQPSSRQQQQLSSSRVDITNAVKPVMAAAVGGTRVPTASFSQPATAAMSKTNNAILQPTPVPKNSSHKKSEPLPPIPQHHYEQAARQMQQSRGAMPAALVDDIKMDSSNPEGLTSLWVGNVQPTISQEILHEMFSKFGNLQSVRVLPEKFCAFVNYVNKDCAGRAMQGLQGHILAGQPLLIKFPDNPVTSSGTSTVDKTLKSSDPMKTIPVQTLSKAQQQQQQQLQQQAMANAAAAAAAATKLRGPVNGDECYFWRTTGCQFTTGCRYRHVPEHKGIDKKPWQRVTK